MKIAKGLYRPRPGQRDFYRSPNGELVELSTPGQRWYTDQVEQGRREIQQQARRHGWGLCGRFPSEALEAE